MPSQPFPALEGSARLARKAGPQLPPRWAGNSISHHCCQASSPRHAGAGPQSISSLTSSRRPPVAKKPASGVPAVSSSDPGNWP